MKLPDLPMSDWARSYDRSALSSDLIAAAIVTLMLIPQSLAYAALAGLPPEVGLYASIVPLLVYAVLGSSRVLAVGPVAVISLMTAAAVSPLAPHGSQAYSELAITLAFMSGGMLLIMGWLRLGFLANFLSQPVISGFITASALIITVSQIQVILGVRVTGSGFFEQAWQLLLQLPHIHALTAAIGLATVALLVWGRQAAKPLWLRWGFSPSVADTLSKMTPVAVIALMAALTWALAWQQAGVRIVGTVPQGFPPLSLPSLDASVWQALMVPALLISVVGFVESVSVGQTLAAKRRQRIVPDRELVALGASNLGSALSSGFPVTGGFSRSAVNFDAGAQTPAAGAFTAIGILLAALLLTPALYFVPQAALSATIVVAVLSMADWRILLRTWRFSRSDFSAIVTTLLVTLAAGIEPGLLAGFSLSLVLYLYKTSRPHLAEVGLVEGTEHFRNVQRYEVKTSAQVMGLRMDESLYFANARVLEDHVNALVADRPQLKHLVLQCSAINDIDISALESLTAINHRLRDAGIGLHLSEVKGPVMDKLLGSELLTHLNGQVFLSHFQAMASLAPDLVTRPAA